MIEPKRLRSLSQVNQFRPMVDMLFCWALIIGGLSFCHESLWFVPISVPIIASRLHALLVLMHDGSHYLLNKNKKINDFLSNVLCSFPLMISTEAYRKTHLKHHRFTQTYKDPNYVIMRSNSGWDFPKPRDEVRKILIKDFFFGNIKDHLLVLRDWQVIPNFKSLPTAEKILFPAFLGSIIGIIALNGLWVEFFVFQASALLVNPLARIRAMSEHVHKHAKGQGSIHKLQDTPTVNANWIERFFIAPFNTNRHLEHHLFPTVPYYNLNKVHSLIKETEPYKAYCKYELDGYLLGNRTAMEEILSDSKSPQSDSNLKKAG